MVIEGKDPHLGFESKLLDTGSPFGFFWLPESPWMRGIYRSVLRSHYMTLSDNLPLLAA